MHTPTLPVPARSPRRVPAALLVAHQDVPQHLGVEQRVVRRQDRPARDAEDDLRADPLERAHERLRSGEALGLVVHLQFLRSSGRVRAEVGS
jgi:hypothetical protein